MKIQLHSDSQLQLIKKKGYLNGSIDYMTCNDKMCIPYQYPFEIEINRPN